MRNVKLLTYIGQQIFWHRECTDIKMKDRLQFLMNIKSTYDVDMG